MLRLARGRPKHRDFAPISKSSNGTSFTPPQSLGSKPLVHVNVGLAASTPTRAGRTFAGALGDENDPSKEPTDVDPAGALDVTHVTLREPSRSPVKC